MSKVIDYIMVSATDQETLVNQVRLLIAQGWQPQGGLCVIQETDICECEFFQALVMFEEERYYIPFDADINPKSEVSGSLLKKGLCEITGPKCPTEVN